VAVCRFWAAFLCLSTFVLNQNVIRAASAFETSAATGKVAVSVFGSGQAPTYTLPWTPEPMNPKPATMMLLVVGLSGLTAVGTRSEGRAGPSAASCI
jgi:hypothetical protein